jgi:parvulin-like peptidyl-prolyl isomerase
MLNYLRMGNKRIKVIWWALTVIIVATFVGGFIVMGGAGDIGLRQAGAVGTVDGEQISRTEFLASVDQQRQLYRRQYGVDPVDRDARYVEVQAWRSMVTEKILDRQARKLGLGASDREVVVSLETSPPNALAQLPDFQTDGKFDPQKYTSAIRNPEINWTPFEELVRKELPRRKLQERMLSSLKLSEPELQAQYRDRFETLNLTVVHVPPMTSGAVDPPTEADLDRVYQEFRGRMNAPERAQLELLQTPIRFGEGQIKASTEMASGLADRARAGEDFAALARDYSEGPGAQQGGLINRPVNPEEFGPDVASEIAALPVGGISRPLVQGSRVTVVKVLERMGEGSPETLALRIAQIVIRVRPEESDLVKQTTEMQQLRDRAARRGVGLAKAASEKGLATMLSGWYDLTNPSQALMDVPEALDWGLLSKTGEVSPVFRSADFFTIAQVSAKREAGPAPKEDVAEQLRQIAEVQARVRVGKPISERVAAAIAQGRPLEAAAREAGATVFQVGGATRQAAQDPRLSATPEVMGAAFAAVPGKVVGPIEATTGYYFIRVDKKTPADPASYDQLKGQLTNEILQQRQRLFMVGWIAEARQHAKIKDLRIP